MPELGDLFRENCFKVPGKFQVRQLHWNWIWGYAGSFGIAESLQFWQYCIQRCISIWSIWSHWVDAHNSPRCARFHYKETVRLLEKNAWALYTKAFFSFIFNLKGSFILEKWDKEVHINSRNPLCWWSCSFPLTFNCHVLGEIKAEDFRFHRII